MPFASYTYVTNSLERQLVELPTYPASLVSSPNSWRVCRERRPPELPSERPKGYAFSPVGPDTPAREPIPLTMREGSLCESFARYGGR